MENKYAKLINLKAENAFKKVKEDIIFLKNNINKCCNNKVKNVENNQKLIEEDIEIKYKYLLKKIEKLEKKLKNQKNIVFSDLTKIEGIGPIIQKLLRENNINTFEDLSKTSVSKLKKILEKNKLSNHDPKTWPEQSKLAFKGKWEELLSWQDILIGGKEI